MFLFHPLLWYPSGRSINEANLTRNKEANYVSFVVSFTQIMVVCSNVGKNNSIDL